MTSIHDYLLQHRQAEQDFLAALIRIPSDNPPRRLRRSCRTNRRLAGRPWLCR